MESKEKISYEEFLKMSLDEKRVFAKEDFETYLKFLEWRDRYGGVDGRKKATEIVADFEKMGITISAAKNILELALSMIETSKVSPRKD